MANECVVSKFNGVYNNSIIPVFGKIKVTRIGKGSSWQNDYVAIRGNTSTAITISSNDLSQVTINGQSVNLPVSVVPSAVQKINWEDTNKSILIDKYHPEISTFVFSNPNDFESDCGTLEDFLRWKDYSNFTEINIIGSKLSGSLADLTNATSLKDLYIGDTNINGHVYDLPHYSLFEKLGIENCGVTGTMAEIGTNISWKELRLLSPLVTGDIVDFINSQISNGKTTCSTTEATTIMGYKNYITIFGQLYSWNAPMFPTWESINKITLWFNGKSAGSGVSIIAKGATDEEIAAWRNAGSNVIIVN